MQNLDEYRLYWTGLTDYDGDYGHKLILQHRKNPDMPYVDGTVRIMRHHPYNTATNRTSDVHA